MLDKQKAEEDKTKSQEMDNQINKNHNKPDYSSATKNEMYDLRRPFKDDGSWDPDNNPEHAGIQNQINKLHGSSKTYPTE